MISNVMEAYTTALFLVDERGECMELYCYQSFCKNIDENCRIKNGEGLIGWVLRERKNVLAANFERNTKTLIFYEEDEKIKSLMALPLPEGLGVLFVDSKKSYSFTEEKEKIFKQFANLIYTCVKEQEILNNNYINDNYLKFLIKFEKISGGRCDFEKLSSLLFEHINCSHFIFVVPEHCVFTYFYEDAQKRNVFIEQSAEYYSPEGLLGWCIKNRKNLVNNNLNTKKSFLLNEDEKIEINNFVGIPVYEKNRSLVGVVGFVKKKGHDTFFKKNIYWTQKEVDYLELLGNKIFKKYVAQELTPHKGV